MTLIPVHFEYRTGLRHIDIRNALLIGSCGRPCRCRYLLPRTAAGLLRHRNARRGRTFRWSVIVDTPEQTSVSGIPTEVNDATSTDRYRVFTLAHANQTERYLSRLHQLRGLDGKRGETGGGMILQFPGRQSRIHSGNVAACRSRSPIARRSEELGAEAVRRGGGVAADGCGATRRDRPAQRWAGPAEHQTQWHGQGDRARSRPRRLRASRARRAARRRSFRSTRSGPSKSRPRRTALASKATRILWCRIW